jgi:imidazolonepropionase-like amidohydrolase
MASGGCITADSPPIWQSQFTDEDLRLIVDEAGAHGLPVAAHAHSTAATRSAAAAGVASIEHCRWLTSDTFDDPDLDSDTADAIARKGIFVCPTIGTAYGLTSGPDFVAHITRVFQWQEQHGIQIVGGTDVGVYPFELYPQHRYLDAYERAGFPTSRIIDIQTRHAAAALGLGAYTGTLAAGYSADLIVVDGDPFAEIAALRQMMLVVAQGHVHVPNRASTQVALSTLR